MTIHHPACREEWLALRHKYVSSTESSALFGLNPYMTAFELFHAKRAAEPTQFEASERMEWGLRLEEAIARSIADVYGIKVRKLNAFVSRDGLGASFDYEIVGVKDTQPEDTVLQAMYRDRGPGILEIKNVDWVVYKRNWTTGDDGFMEAPAHIEIQVQQQLHVIERAWAAIGVLVGGNSLKLLVRERDEEVGKALVTKSAEFWRAVRANQAPPVDEIRDANIIAHLYNYAEPDKVLDAQSDSEEAKQIAKLVREYYDAGQRKSDAERQQKAAKAALLPLIGDAERVLCPDGFTVSAGMVAAAEVKAFTRAAYRNLRITKAKGDAK